MTIEQTTLKSAGYGIVAFRMKSRGRGIITIEHLEPLPSILHDTSMPNGFSKMECR